MKLGGDVAGAGGCLEEGGDKAGRVIAAHVVEAEAALLYRTEEHQLGGLQEHVLEHVGLALGVDEVDVIDSQVYTMGSEPYFAEAVGVEGAGPGNQGVKLSRSPGSDSFLDSASKIFTVDLPGSHPAGGQLHPHHGQRGGELHVGEPDVLLLQGGPTPCTCQ